MPKKKTDNLDETINVKVSARIFKGMNDTAKLQGRTVSDISRELYAKYLKEWLIKRYL
jgi:hypothetical protein